MKWVIATLGIAALAAVAVTTEMPWLLKKQPAMVRSDTPGAPENEGNLTCPADSKTANLNFTLKDVKGKDVSLTEFKGKVVLLDFWATWCGPCKIEIPHFIEFQNAYGPEGFQVIGVSVDDTADKLEPYVSEMKMNYPVLQGLGHDDLQDAYGPIFGIPVSVLISREGKICATHTGLTGKDVFEREIKSLL
jgi:thiol-disulfide isomerase/thioredoxin